MTQQKALLIPSKGAPFEMGTRPIPTPGPGQVLIKNVAVALNPVDHYVQLTGMFVEQYGYPALAGRDGAGAIEAVGEGVHAWKKGDKVLYKAYWPPDRQAFQEYTIAESKWISKIPSHMTFEQASTIPLCFVTTVVGLYETRSSRGDAGLTPPWEEGGRGKYAGQPAVVIGGSSSVGQFALQVLKLSGFNPIITTASKQNEEYCKAAGATHVLDYHDVPYPELPAAIKKITSIPIGLVYAAVAQEEEQKAGWAALGPKGVLVTTFPPVVEKCDEEAGDDRRAVGVHASVAEAENLEFGERMYTGLTNLLEKGDVKPNKLEIVPGGLAGIPDGIARLMKGVSGVKLVARVEETA